MSKVPIETLPVEIRMQIYELGDVSSIPPEYGHYGFPWARTILMAGILNDKDAIEIAAKQGNEPRNIMCSYIALSGNLLMMRWARSDKSSTKDDEAPVIERSMKQIRLTPFPWDEDTCRNASKYGHLKLLQWLHEQGCPWDRLTFSDAATFGNIEMLEWLYQKKCPWDSWTFCRAAKSENLDVLKWFYDRKCPWDEGTFHTAVGTGNLDLVKWLHEHKCPWSKYSVLDVAASTQNLTLVDRGYGHMTGETCNSAALNGNFENLKWLHEQGCPLDSMTCARAAQGGHLQILKWLHEQGCPWDSMSCTFAAQNGDLKILKWLHKHGCPWDSDCCAWAAYFGHIYTRTGAHGTKILVRLQQWKAV